MGMLFFALGGLSIFIGIVGGFLHMPTGYIITTMIVGGFFILQGHVKNAHKRRLKELQLILERVDSYPVDNATEKIKNMSIKNTPIAMLPNELLLQICNANSVRVKEKTIGYKSSHKGSSIRITKGLSFNSGNSITVPVKGMVTEKSPGLFYITTQRLIMVSQKYAFNVKHNQILNLQFAMDGIELYLTNSKYYRVELLNDDIERVFKTFKLLSAYFGQH